ncbi:MAG TPA: ATP-binding protein, partial [Rhizomicrobium sp.]|nr:ATP-binding protein [Rhizomicrobium sp.]
GTGLGLAIVKHIISRHQGRLNIESKLGEGSVFTVLLPAAPPEIALKPAIPEPVTEML